MDQPALKEIPEETGDKVTVPLFDQPARFTNPELAEFNRAAKELGAKRFTVERLKASNSVGRLIKASGSIKLGRSVLLLSLEHTENGIEQCDEILESQGVEASVRTSALSVKREFVAGMTSIGESFIRSAELDGRDGEVQKPPIRAFEPGKKLTVIHGNATIVDKQMVMEKKDGDKPVNGV